MLICILKVPTYCLLFTQKQRQRPGPYSKIIVRLLAVMKHAPLMNWSSSVSRAEKIINLTRRLNNCEAVSPRYDVPLKDLKQLQNNLLPSHQFGFIILTTSTNTMNQQDKNTQEEKFWASSSGNTYIKHINKMSQ